MSAQELLVALGQLTFDLFDAPDDPAPALWVDPVDHDIEPATIRESRPTSAATIVEDPEPPAATDVAPSRHGAETPAERAGLAITRSQARAVLRWAELGVNVLTRWRLMYGGLDNMPTDGDELVQRARLLAGPVGG